MLIEFTVGNYLSFKDKKTLSLEATAIKEYPNNVIKKGKYKLLRSAVVYGANSSGKSNLIKALELMFDFVKTSFQANSTDEINVTSFLLNKDTEDKPSFFEILFLIDDIRYRYGFEVDKKRFYSEWLFEQKFKKEKLLFIREKDSIEVSNDFKEGKGIEEKTRNNALFLSVVDQFNGVISKKIMGWFNSQIIFSGLNHQEAKILTSLVLKFDDSKEIIKNFLIPFNLGFKDFELVSEKDKNNVKTYHDKYDKKGNVIGNFEFDLVKNESSGTNKLYDIAGCLIYVLSMGQLIVIDELDAKLHPLLTMAIVKLFNSSEYNKENAQLIFATHDTNLLNCGCFRRDQIYFTEKNRTEETDLYSLVEYKESDGKKIRNDSSFEKDYINGRYGAIPYIGDFSKFLSHDESEKD